MPNFTYKEFIDAGFTITFYVNYWGGYEGMLSARGSRMILTGRDLKELKRYKNIYKMLKKSAKIIKISGREGYYVLQMLDIHYQDDNEEMGYYLLEDIESDTSIDGLLEKYDLMKKETNVKTMN